MRVLLLTHRLPYAPNRGDRIRAYHLLAALQRVATVDLVSLVHDREEAQQVEAMRARGVNVLPAPVTPLSNYVRAACTLPTHRPLTLELLHSPGLRRIVRGIVSAHPPDVVIAYCSSMARYALEPELRPFPFVLDIVDVDSEKWAALGADASQPLRLIYRREARCLGRFEQLAVERSALTLVVNEREEASVRRLAPRAPVRVLPNGIDVSQFKAPGAPSDHPVVVFCGVMNYAPNVQAARRIATSIWPLVSARRPDARLVLAGADPTSEVRGFAALPGVEVTGSLPDIRPVLWRSAVAAAPLVTARGIQNKVLEALAAGLPAVVSPIVAEGVPPTALKGCRV